MPEPEYPAPVDFTVQLVEVLILTTGTLLWARWSNLDLGLRSPAMEGVWAWSLLFVVWVTVEEVIQAVGLLQVDHWWLRNLEELSLAEDVVLNIVLGPIQEELLFRGALFSALMRRWGPWAAILVPSALWALLHTQYEPWQVASISGSGAVLAIIRWKSGSLYVPIALHAGANLLDILLSD